MDSQRQRNHSSLIIFKLDFTRIMAGGGEK